MGTERKYNHVGNIHGGYHNPRREVNFVSLLAIGEVELPEMFLKLYDMHKQGSPLPDPLVKGCSGFLEKELEAKGIGPNLGLGFAILSEDSLNVALWDIGKPIVLRNQLYGFENQNLATAQKLSIDDAGAFCAWELGIVNFERNAWLKYLGSGRMQEDKKAYLDSVIEGLL
jgi:hypothetical protein